MTINDIMQQMTIDGPIIIRNTDPDGNGYTMNDSYEYIEAVPQERRNIEIAYIYPVLENMPYICFELRTSED